MAQTQTAAERIGDEEAEDELPEFSINKNDFFMHGGGEKDYYYLKDRATSLSVNFDEVEMIENGKAWRLRRSGVRCGKIERGSRFPAYVESALDEIDEAT